MGSKNGKPVLRTGELWPCRVFDNHTERDAEARRRSLQSFPDPAQQRPESGKMEND